jgi:hypothetical protein
VKAIILPISFLMAMALIDQSRAADLSASVKGQSAYGTETDQLQQQEWLFDIEYHDALWQGEVTAITRLRVDTVDDLNLTERADSYSSIGGPVSVGRYTSLDLREIYWEYSQH